MQRWKGARQTGARTDTGNKTATPPVAPATQKPHPPPEGSARRFGGGGAQQRKKSPPPGGTSSRNPAKPTTPTSPSTLQVPGLQVPNIVQPPPSPRMSSAKSKKKMRMRTHRYTSNVFSMFNQAQIQEFKEAFNMIDQNRDGFVDKDDLIEMLTSLGKNPTDVYLDEMIGEAPGPINFTMFLTLFGEKLNGTDPEDVIQNAFACFDQRNTGVLTEEYLREIMTTMGDRWTDEMVDELLHGAPIDNGLFDYIEFTRTLKHGAKEKDEEPGEQQPQTPNSGKSLPGTGQQGQPPSPRTPTQIKPLSPDSAKTPSKPLQPPPRRR